MTHCQAEKREIYQAKKPFSRTIALSKPFKHSQTPIKNELRKSCSTKHVLSTNEAPKITYRTLKNILKRVLKPKTHIWKLQESYRARKCVTRFGRIRATAESSLKGVLGALIVAKWISKEFIMSLSRM